MARNNRISAVPVLLLLSFQLAVAQNLADLFSPKVTSFSPFPEDDGSVSTKASGSQIFLNNDNIETRIVGGEDAAAGDFPSFAHVPQSSNGCGGVLVRPNIVITSAQCRLDFKVNGLVAIGKTTRTDVSNLLQIKQIKVHPDFDDATKRNDIMVAILKEPSTAPVAKLIDGSAGINLTSTTATIMGFGRSNPDVSELAGTLKKIPMKVDPFSACQSKGYSNIDKDEHICAESVATSTGGACRGDFGGPLTQADGTVIALFSQERNACTGPQIYTDLRYYDVFVRVSACELNNFEPAAECNLLPSNAPSSMPSISNSPTTSVAPSLAPSSQPSISIAPSSEPTDIASEQPSAPPSTNPSGSPTNAPTHNPTRSPTFSPTHSPTRSPTNAPTHTPTHAPTARPSSAPSSIPSVLPSSFPSSVPSFIPSFTPSALPSGSSAPSISNAPSIGPTNRAGLKIPPTMSPSTNFPSTVPSSFVEPVRGKKALGKKVGKKGNKKGKKGKKGKKDPKARRPRRNPTRWRRIFGRRRRRRRPRQDPPRSRVRRSSPWRSDTSSRRQRDQDTRISNRVRRQFQGRLQRQRERLQKQKQYMQRA